MRQHLGGQSGGGGDMEQGCGETQLLQVELRASILRSASEGDFVVKGVWYFTGMGRGDNFEWRCPASRCELDQYGVPKSMVCVGSFDACFSSIKESEVVLEFSPDNWVNDTIRNNVKSPRNPVVAGMLAADSTQRVLYSVRGHGRNAIGTFTIEGLLNVSTSKIPNSNRSTVLRFQAKKTYDRPRNDKAANCHHPMHTSGSCTCSEEEVVVAGERENRRSASSSSYGCISQASSSSPDEQRQKRKRKKEESQNRKRNKRERGETNKAPTAKEARLRAQHWRRQQLRNATLCSSSTFGRAFSLPRPVIKEAKHLGPGQIRVSWEITTQSTGSLALLTETSLSLRRSTDHKGRPTQEHRIVDFPPFALTREKDTFSPTRQFSHTLDNLEPGKYEVCVLVRPYGNPTISEQTFDTVETIVSARPDAPRDVTALTYATPRGGKRYAVISWSPPTVRNSSEEIMDYQVQCQLFRKARGDWVTLEPSRRTIRTGLPINNCIVPDLPRNERIRLTVAAVGPFGSPGHGAPSTVLDTSCATISAPNCVICGDDISFSSDHTQEHSSLVPLAPGTATTPSTHGNSAPCGPDSCSHMFHTGCLMKWARKKNTCPLCCRSFHMIVQHTLYANAQHLRRTICVQTDNPGALEMPGDLVDVAQPTQYAYEWDEQFIQDVYEAIFGDSPGADDDQREHVEPHQIYLAPPNTPAPNEPDDVVVALINEII